MDLVFIFSHFRVLYSNLRYVKNTYQHWLFDPFGWVGGFQHVDLWAPQVGNCNPITAFTSSGLYIYIYMRIMLFIHILFVLIVFNTCIYININTKIFSDSYCKEIDWKKLQVSWGCICCFLFQSKAQRSKGMGTWPDIQQSQVSVNCFGSLPLEASGFRAFLNCRTAWLKFWEVVICGG